METSNLYGKILEWSDTVQTLLLAEEMEKNGASDKAITEFLKIAIYFHGYWVAKILNVDEDLSHLKKYIY